VCENVLFKKKREEVGGKGVKNESLLSLDNPPTHGLSFNEKKSV